MSSLGRRMRRGKVDQFGRKIPKRLYNNSKRTKGRQGQEKVKMHYHEMMKRMKYIKKLIIAMVNDNVYLKDDTWVKQIREYDKEQLIFDEYEKMLIFEKVNHMHDYKRLKPNETKETVELK